MSYLKHKEKKPKRSLPVPKQAEAEPMTGIQYLDVKGLDDLSEAMSTLANAVRCYAYNATIGDNSLCLFTGSEQGGYSPMRLVLEGEPMESIADSLKRIADAMAASKENCA